MKRARLSGWAYVIGLAGAGLAFAIRYALAPVLGDTAVYPLFVLAVLAGTYAGGIGPGVVTAMVGFLLADYFFIPPRGVIGHFTATSAMDCVVYGVACAFTVALVESLRRVRAKLEADIRAREELQAQLHRAHAELEQTVAKRTASLTETVHQLETLSYSLSHDLRAPLRAMEGYARVVELKYGPTLPDEAKELLRRIARAAARLDALIKDVLTYHRTASEPIELHPVDLDRLFEELVPARPDLQAAGAALRVERPLLKVMGHEALLTQIISNLLSNAVRFVSPERQPQVRLWTEPVPGSNGSAGHVRLNVQDNGIGIAPADQERVWGIFNRLDPEHYEGTGIGLAVVRKAAERMGGSVGITSEPGNGSQFWVELPSAS
ncbi:MAG TPA: ATP-binding protein [Verrucomicrobiae bacterium]|nr:ATP-binding protein [Verrucomicrobiae bacterium]